MRVNIPRQRRSGQERKAVIAKCGTADHSVSVRIGACAPPKDPMGVWLATVAL